ncbi:Uu.00g007860.m01.CDS01 [Anthostomella pinea]|uniref:Uu.00g007860.m01.CDS01 n=1 Tax=Anthostomella pinea TaxID=933095 RepID=A0AAI8VX22_9PEZI|nr:Uu.00g007860.m01.CDS01 [Anthostomella pinea]
MAWSKAVIPALLAFPATIATAGFTAFKDSQCTQPLKIISDGEEVVNNTLQTDRSIMDWTDAAGRWYDAMEYSNATLSGSMSGTGSANVYWSVGDLDPGCQLILMKDVEQAWQTINPLPGNLILSVAMPGCYYSSLVPQEGLITSFCCGNDDCERVQLESNGGSQKRSVDKVAVDERYLVDPAQEKADIAKRAPISNAGRAVDYVKAARRFISGDPLVKRDDVPECTISGDPGSPYYTSGIQRSVTQPETCDTGPGTCSHSVSVSTEASTALSKSSSSSWTVTGGGSVSVDAGVDFIVDTKVTTTLSFSVAKAWSNETGTTLTTGTTNGTTQTLVQQVGTTAFLSFTPQYECWQSDATCGQDADGNDIVVQGVDFCQPLTGGDGKLSGTYSVVYISN